MNVPEPYEYTLMGFFLKSVISFKLIAHPSYSIHPVKPP